LFALINAVVNFVGGDNFLCDTLAQLTSSPEFGEDSGVTFTE
jgi:hypothetical protein